MSYTLEHKQECIRLRRTNLSINTIANKMGISLGTILRWCKAEGLDGVLADTTIINPRNQYTNGKYDQLGEALKKYVDGKPWTYVRGFLNTDSKAIFRCNECGTETELSFISFRNKNRKGCPACKRCEEVLRNKRREEKAIEKATQALLKQENLEKQRRISQQKRRKQLSLNFCECGKVISTKAKRCSVCAKKIANSNHEHHRRMLTNQQMVDRDISLIKLSKRDNNICHVCNKEVDWNDIKIEKGTHIAGNFYPSIDHLIPISKGGDHSWHNVKLAHRMCNVNNYIHNQRMITYTP